MIKIEDALILEGKANSLKKQGYDGFIITVDHLGHVIISQLGDSLDVGINIESFIKKYSLRNKPNLLLEL